VTEPVVVIPPVPPALTPIEATVPPEPQPAVVLESPPVDPPPPPWLDDDDRDDTFVEWGLRSPDGAVHWGQFNTKPLTTPVDRYMMVIALRRTANELGIPESDFVSGYSWVGRNARQVVHRTFTDAGAAVLDSELVVTPPGQQ
jgi:hypothetical protein